MSDLQGVVADLIGELAGAQQNVYNAHCDTQVAWAVLSRTLLASGIVKDTTLSDQTGEYFGCLALISLGHLVRRIEARKTEALIAELVPPGHEADTVIFGG